jgi:hypothetical protein
MRHLRQVWGGWLGRGSYGKMADVARAGWWLWSALIRLRRPEEFNPRDHGTGRGRFGPAERLGAAGAGGVSREWNWGGFGAAAVPSTRRKVALTMYERFPESCAV